MNPLRFDPASIPRYSVIQHPIKFPHKPETFKLFVTITHQEGHLVCLKTTAQEWFHEGVLYEAGELEFFTRDTVIQISNLLPISYHEIQNAHKKGRFKVLGSLPSDFHRRLFHAVKKAELLDPRRQQRLLNILIANRKLSLR